MASTSENNQLPQLVQSLERVPGLRQGLMLLALAGSIALGVTAVLWIQRPMYSALPPMKEMSQGHDLLVTEGIRVDDRGDRLAVPVHSFERALRILEEGGYASADSRNCQDMAGPGGMVRSMKEELAALRCRRELEIARSITNMRPIRSASVHISDPDDGPFIGDEYEPKASVEISLMPGHQADQELVQSIMHLAANAFPRLTPEHVIVVDDNGRHLSSVFGTGMARTNEQLRHQRTFEQQKEEQIRKILGRTLGAEHYTVTVSAEMDFSSVERTERRPTEAVVIGTTEQVTEQAGTMAPPSGVPGGLTNSPVPTGGTPEGEGQGEGQGDGGAQGQNGQGGTNPRSVSRSVTTNSDVGEAYEVFKSPRGRLQRLTIAVLLNELAPRPTAATAGAAGAGTDDTAADAGEPPAQPADRFPPEELVKIETLIRDAVAFDADRGDRISIESMAFQPMTVAEIPPSPWWQQPLVMDLARQALGALFVVVLFFTTIRPVISRLMASSSVALTPAAAGAYGQAALAGPGDLEDDERNGGGDYQKRVANARNIASEDPDRVAQIMRDWVNKE